MSNPYDKFIEELKIKPRLWQPSPMDISDALAASMNWDMKKLSLHNLRALRVAAALWLEEITRHDKDVTT